MLRRSIISVAGGVTLGAALPVLGQTQRVPHLGILGNLSTAHPDSGTFWPDLLDNMRRLGWENGRNLIIDHRFSMRDAQRMLVNAKELVEAKVDVIYAATPNASRPALQMTQSIPIVMIDTELVERGFARSLARPGGNVTGVSYRGTELAGNEFELVFALRPDTRRIGLAGGVGDPGVERWIRRWQAAASSKGVTMVPLSNLSSVAEIDTMLAIAKRESVQVLVLAFYPFLRGAGLDRINTWAIQNNVLPYSNPWTTGNVALAFGENILAASYIPPRHIDRILRGANPADIPIEQPDKFDLVINKKIAKALGLTIPQSVMLQATEVIE